MGKRITNKGHRGLYRWEFVRRNEEYIKDYFDAMKDKSSIVDLRGIDGKCEQYFLNKYLVYPLNPNFSFDDILKIINRYKVSEKKRGKQIHKIQRDILGKNWTQINGLLLRYSAYEMNKNNGDTEFTKKSLVRLKDALGSKWKKEINYLCKQRVKVDKEIEKRELTYKRNKIEHYLKVAIYQMNDIKLLPEEPFIYNPQTSILCSYLLDDSNISVSHGVGKTALYDNSIDNIDINPFLEEYEGDVSQVCIEVDLTLPQKQIMVHIEKEISAWKTIYREKIKLCSRTDMYATYLRIYDLKNEGKNDAEIACIAFKYDKAKGLSLIKKVQRSLAKAKELVDGGYRHIR